MKRDTDRHEKRKERRQNGYTYREMRGIENDKTRRNQEMRGLKFLGLVTFCALSTSVWAQTTSTPPDRSQIEAALSDCASQVTLDANGHPDRQAMDTCMSNKGFTKPPAPLEGGRGPQGSAAN